MPNPPYRWLDHGNFAGGMVQDVPRHMLPDGAVWDAVDCFVGEEGTLHKRGSTVTALSSASTISPSVIGFCQSAMETNFLRGYIIDESNGAAGSSILGAFTPGSGTFTVTASTWTQPLVSVNGVGRPFQHGGYVVFPFRAPSTPSASAYRMFGACAGSVNSALTTNTTSVTVNTGVRTITGYLVADVNAMADGDVVFIEKNGASDKYMGRITRRDNVTGTIWVSPTPTRTFTSGTGGTNTETFSKFLGFIGVGVSAWRGAQGGASWQNRTIFGGVTRELASAVYDHLQNRIIWSLLPTELSAINAIADGDLWLSDYGYPANNYADVPWMNQVLGLEPVSDGELLITGRPLCSRLVGTLNTNTTTSGGLTYELRPLNQKIQCIDDRATVRTPQGVMMMGPDGIYLYREGNLINTTVGRIQNYFLDNYANSTVHGAGVLPNNHYYLSTSFGTLLCNMDGFRWTRLQNIDITNCFADPSDTTRVFACRYQPGTASNTTKLVRADYLVNPSSAATTDVSGSGPLMAVKTKTYTDGDASRLKQFRHTEATVRMPGSSGTWAVVATPGLDGEESSTTILTNTFATSAVSKRADGTTLSRAMGLQFTQTGNPDECELIDIDLAVRPARLGRTA